MARRSRRPDYGLDGPVLLLRLLGAGAVCIVVTVVAGRAGIGFLAALGVLGALGCFAVVGAMLWTSRSAKLRERDRILELAELDGDEVLLDIGCGRGLLLVAAAKLLPAGEAVGVDVWRSGDLTANTPAGALHNARLEGVTVAVETGDARKLPFDDDTFDVVVSASALHHVPGPGGRRTAMREIDRVLKPGGRIVLVDSGATDEYVTALRGVGWRDVEASERLFRMFPPFRYVVGRSPT